MTYLVRDPPTDNRRTRTQIYLAELCCVPSPAHGLHPAGGQSWWSLVSPFMSSRVQFPVAGYYHCPNIGLSFAVTRAVTIEIGFCAWSQHLDKDPFQDSHMVAGPLFDINAERGAVAAVYLPHFVDLQGNQG